jgi:hypothetical protein
MCTNCALSWIASGRYRRCDRTGRGHSTPELPPSSALSGVLLKTHNHIHSND